MRKLLIILMAVVVAGLGLPASAAVFFFTGSDANLGPDETYTVDGITLTVSPNVAGHIDRDGTGIGVSLLGVADVGELDGEDVIESLHFDFDQDVVLHSIRFSVWEASDDATFTGLSISFHDGGVASVTGLNDLILDANGFDIGAATGNFIDPNDFRIHSLTVTPIPLPAAAWLFGSALLGVIGLRRRK